MKKQTLMRKFKRLQREHTALCRQLDVMHAVIKLQDQYFFREDDDNPGAEAKPHLKVVGDG